MDKDDFIGKSALVVAPRAIRMRGLLCEGEPLIGGAVFIDGRRVGRVTAGATSPYLAQGVGFALFDEPAMEPGTPAMIDCIDGAHAGALAALPLYDDDAAIPRGKLVDVP